MKLRDSLFWMLPVIYFLWMCCTYFWDTSGGFTIKELERYTIFLFVPPALALIPRISQKNIRTALLLFSVTTILICLICLWKAYQEYNVTGDYRVFYYQYLGEQMELNAIFLSNYCLASITWLLYFGFIEKSSKSISIYVGVIAGCAFLLFMLFLLSSKLILVLTFFIIILFVLALGYLRGYFFRSLLIILVVLGAGFFAVQNMHYLNWRINTTEFKTYSGPEDDNNGIAIRLFMWERALELIEERPLLGYGLRGARLELLESYRKNNFDLGVRGYYHSHSQYLESSLMAGIPATILLICFIAMAFRKAISRKNFLLMLMVSHFMIQSIFEATFEVQHELVFYTFFIFLFYFHAPEGTNKFLTT